MFRVAYRDDSSEYALEGMMDRQVGDSLKSIVVDRELEGMKAGDSLEYVKKDRSGFLTEGSSGLRGCVGEPIMWPASGSLRIGWRGPMLV